MLAPSGIEGDSDIARLSNSPTFRAAISHYFHLKKLITTVVLRCPVAGMEAEDHYGHPTYSRCSCKLKTC